MTVIEQFVKERNEALFSLDRKKIETYFAKYGEPLPDNDIVFWAMVHKCICNIKNAPGDLVKESTTWLLAHGMSPSIF
jgi:hypothetical protein